MTHEETVVHLLQARSAQYRSEAGRTANPGLANVYRLVAESLENVAIALRADRAAGVQDAVAVLAKLGS